MAVFVPQITWTCTGTDKNSAWYLSYCNVEFVKYSLTFPQRDNSVLRVPRFDFKFEDIAWKKITQIVRDEMTVRSSHVLHKPWQRLWDISHPANSPPDMTHTSNNHPDIPHLGRYRPRHNIEGIVQEIRNSSALAMDLRLSCTDQSIFKRNFLYACCEIIPVQGD